MNQENFQVAESSKYENLVDIIPSAKNGKQPEKPKNAKPDYPFTIKVHTWTLGGAEKFARAIRHNLSSDRSSFVFSSSDDAGRDNSYTETRQDPFKKKTTHKARLESQLWVNTVEFVQDGWVPYITFHITFEAEHDFLEFCKRVKQRLSVGQSFMNFPATKARVHKHHWVSAWKNPNPRYPMYIVSKGRGDSRLTSRFFERTNIPYYIVIEPQDYDEYACVIDEKKILVLPFSNHGDGPGRARNWCWDHSISKGFKRHWVFDDNITDFSRLYRHRKLPIADGGMFRVIEEFVDRFKNVPISGLQYDFFTPEKVGHPPFILNTRIYSALLIENSCPHRWRGRYNEDTILSLDVLKDGYCTMQFHALLQGKSPTQKLSGGNTAEFYSKEGTYNKSLMLEAAHPDVAKTVWKFGRWHHEVDYRPFRGNKLEYVEGYDPASNLLETNGFTMKRVRCA
jgi:hypothetical protein